MHHVSVFLALATLGASAQVRYPLPYPPRLPGGKALVTHQEKAFLNPGPNLRPGVAVAKTPPKVDFMFYLVPVFHDYLLVIWVALIQIRGPPFHSFFFNLNFHLHFHL